MLILTRRQGESFCIGDDIKITITELSGDKVKTAKIGIEAPKTMRVLREELIQTISSNQQAMTDGFASKQALRELAARVAPGRLSVGQDGLATTDAQYHDE